MIAPTAEEYLWQFQRLLPRGRVWHRGWGTVQAADLLTLMPTWVRLHGRSDELLVDAFPCSTTGLLPEWEASLGLPDPCIGPLHTLQERQAAVCAKFTARGGASIAYFNQVALSIGYHVRIEQFLPQAPGAKPPGMDSVPITGNDWAYAWRIVVGDSSAASVTYFRAGKSRAGERLVEWGNKTLECLITLLAPAHTYPIFAYSPQSIWDVGLSTWDHGASIWDAT